MSSSKRRGIRIGHYRITPLGVGTLAALVVIIAAVVVLLTFGKGMDTESKQLASSTVAPSPSATAEPAEPTATPKPTEVPEPTATPEPEARSATIRVLGEIVMEMDLLKAGYNQSDESFDFSGMFSEISDIIGNADYTIADVEGTLGDTQGFSAKSDKMLTPSVLAQNLADAGVDMLMLGNDHIMDGGFDELTATIAKVSDAGLDYVGAVATAEEKTQPVVKEINGIQVGFVAYCEALSSGKTNVAAVNLIAESSATADIKAVKEAGAEVVIAIVNWGEKFSHTPNKTQVKVAEVLSACGADVILGYNPQAVQPVMWMDATVGGEAHRTLCLGAPGTLLSNQRNPGTDCGVIFEFTLQEQEDGSIAVEAPQYIPTYALRYKDSNGLYQYRAVATGRYTGEAEAELPEGMSATDVQYMQKLEAAIQSVMGADTAAMISE